MALAKQSIDHLARVLEIAEALAAHGITLFEHDYNYLAFGSFSITFGDGHRRVQCQWDGKESLLSISFADLMNQNSVAKWTHDADISLPNGVGIYEEIASNVQDMIRN